MCDGTPEHPTGPQIMVEILSASPQGPWEAADHYRCRQEPGPGGGMDERTWSVVQSVQQFLDEVVNEVRGQGETEGPAVSTVVAEHRGRAPGELPIVRLDVDAHQFVNLDVAMAALIEENGGGRTIGVGGGDMRHHQTFGDMVQQSGPWHRFRVAAVDRERVETGTSSHRAAVTFGIPLFRYRGEPVAVHQRRANMQF